MTIIKMPSGTWGQPRRQMTTQSRGQTESCAFGPWTTCARKLIWYRTGTADPVSDKSGALVYMSSLGS